MIIIIIIIFSFTNLPAYLHKGQLQSKNNINSIIIIILCNNVRQHKITYRSLQTMHLIVVVALVVVV